MPRISKNRKAELEYIEELENKVVWLNRNLGKIVVVNTDRYTRRKRNAKKKLFVFEGWKKGGNERGEPVAMLRHIGTRLFKTYHVDYIVDVVNVDETVVV